MTVSYCGEMEIDSAQYDTSKNSNNSAKIFFPIGPLPNAQAGSNDEKKGVKSLVGLSFLG